MKKTISITLNGIVFNIEEDAYGRLNSYLESLKRHFGEQEYGKEVVNDIESRIGEQFSSRMRDRKTEVITLPEVETVIKTMGTVDDLGDEAKNTEAENGRASSRRLYRNPDDQVVAGVSSGIASYFNIDPLLPRLGFIIFTLAGGYGLLLYVILWIIVPEAKTSAEKLEMKGAAVTVANLEESRKEKKPSRDFSIIRYFFRELIYLAARFFKALGPIILTIIGLLATAVAFVGIFAVTLMAIILLFNPEAPYIEPEIAQIFTGRQYTMLISSAYVALIIPAVTALLIGVSFVRRRSVFNTGVGATFMVLWLAGALTFGVMASSAAPQIEAAIQRLESQPDSSRQFQVTGFDSVRAKDDQIIKIKYGPEYSVVVYGSEKDLADLSINARNRVLNLNLEDRDFRICLICWNRTLTAEITMPSLNTADADHASNIEVAGFENLDQVRLEASGASEITFTGSASLLVADVAHAAKMDLAGQVQNLRATTAGASRLNAEDLVADVVEISSEHSSHADVQATQSLDAEASGASRIFYSGSPPDKSIDASEAGRVTQK